MAVEGLSLCQLVDVVSVSERVHTLIPSSDLVLDEERVSHCLSRQSEGRTPTEAQLMSCLSSHLQLTRGEGETCRG